MFGVNEAFPSRAVAATAIAVILAMAAALVAMGREPWCSCGYVKLWHGVVQSAENSQHLTDWYTFSHIVHGIGFYFVAWWLAPGTAAAMRLLLTTILEAAWEVVENTDFVINRYREATIALDYFGDSVVNSVCDVGACLFGFWLAWKLPPKVTLTLAVALELGLALAIRDNLTLNILMLAWPIDAVRAWQTGAP